MVFYVVGAGGLFTPGENVRGTKGAGERKKRKRKDKGEDWGGGGG